VIRRPEKFEIGESVKERGERRGSWSVTNLLVVGHEIAVSRVALGEALEKSIHSVVVAALFFVQFIVMRLDEFFDLLLIHLNKPLAFWVDTFVFFVFVSNSAGNLKESLTSFVKTTLEQFASKLLSESYNFPPSTHRSCVFA
jgi:hypothetical protein